MGELGNFSSQYKRHSNEHTFTERTLGDKGHMWQGQSKMKTPLVPSRSLNLEEETKQKQPHVVGSDLLAVGARYV